MRWLTCLAALAVTLGSQCHAADLRIRIDKQYRHVELGPLSSHQWKDIETDLSSKAAQILTVHVGKPASFNSRPVLGTYSRVGDQLRFEPRFAFRPGLSHVVRSAVQLSDEPARIKLRSFSRPAQTTAKRHHVEAVFPSASRLPENLLKFYIHFSGPMSRGEVYRRVRLVTDDGVVDLPFLELGEELWDPEGRRLTLLFDPGRIKRGLKPREDSGQILLSNQRYVLKIDAGWPDAQGNPLAENYQKEFVVTSADYTQPDASKWRLKIPAGRTRQPLVVTFSESMDHAMSQRVLSVVGPSGIPVRGKISLSQQETRWLFQPDDPWSLGDYRLMFDTALEDVAGNSIGRPFEVVDSASQQQPSFGERRFTIGPAARE